MPVPFPKVAIVILNWNGWCDTVECLESIFRSDYPDYRVIVCDNGSTDDSVQMIRTWAEGRHPMNLNGAPWAVLSQDRLPKPIPYIVYDRMTAEIGGDLQVDTPLTLIDTGSNLGFAGGNNVGLRYALARGYFSHVWLLNNDTVVRPDALRGLVQRMIERPDAGICGSTLIYYDTPNIVQALGGAAFDYGRGVGHHLGVGEQLTELPVPAIIEKSLSYVVGASMLVTREFLSDVGLMSEDYFLYYEEIDWSVRSRGKFSLAWSPESIVYHKEGASIGSSHHARPSAMSLKYLYRNRLKFTRRHAPEHYWSVVKTILIDGLVYLKRMDREAVAIIVQALFNSGFVNS